jgi:hypothetical protein
VWRQQQSVLPLSDHPKSKLPSASVEDCFTATCLAAEMKRLTSIGEFFSGAVV